MYHVPGGANIYTLNIPKPDDEVAPRASVEFRNTFLFYFSLSFYQQ